MVLGVIQGFNRYVDTIGRSKVNKEDLLSSHKEHIRHLENSLRFEQARTELLQSRLDRVLRLVDTGVKVENKQEPIPMSRATSPMQQRHTLEAESRRKYWEDKVKKVSDLPDNVVSSSTTGSEN